MSTMAAIPLSNTVLSFLTARSLLSFVAAYLIYSCLAQIVRHRYLSPLRHFPGPFWASVTRLWIAWHNWRSTECETELALHKKHGPVIRITPTMLLVSSATKLPEIYARNADKSRHYVSGSFGKMESLFNMQDHRVHAHFRRIAAGPYAFSHIKKMEPLVDARIRQFISALEERFASVPAGGGRAGGGGGGKGVEFDFAPWAVYMAYDIVSEIGFGEPIGFVEAGSDIGGLVQAFHDGLPIFGLLSRLWPLTYALKNTWLGEKFLVAKPEDESGIGLLMRRRDQLLAQRRREIAEGKARGRVDLLQTFIDARDEHGQPLPDDYIKAEILLVLLAGSDTTGTAFQGMVCHVVTRPAIYEKLMREIDAATREGKIVETPQYDDVLEHCPYYVACVKETMRLSPSAPNIFPRVVGEGGMVLPDGKLVPAGTEVAANPWLVHRDPAVFGQDAEVFRPERWLEDEGQTRLLNRYNMTFGYGPRSCLGKDIALMELYKAPLLFFRTFVPHFPNEKEPGKYTVSGGVAFWREMWMTIEKRRV